MKWHHAGVQVKSLTESIEFYKELFGYRLEHYLHLPGERIAFLKIKEVKIELIESEEQPNPGSIHLAWQVESIEEWMRKLEVNGLHPLEGPFNLKNGWITVFYEGPNHEVIELIQVKNSSEK